MHVRYLLLMLLILLCALVHSTPLSPSPSPLPSGETPVLAGTLPPPIFEATDEWQPVLEGQSIPAGLHVRMDVYNGGRWAKKLAPDGSEGGGSAAAAAGSSAVVAVVDGQGEVLTGAQPPSLDSTVPSAVKGGKEVGEKEVEVEDPAITAAVKGLSASEAAKARILLGLPEPEPLLSAAASSQLPPEELEALLAKVWAKRQEQVKEAWDSFKTEGQQMKGVLDSLELGANSEPITHAQFLEKLEDLEYHVSNVHNAEDFAAMGGLAAMAKYLNSSEEGVPARAAWVIGSAVKGQPNLVDIAIADGVTISLAVFFRNTLGASEACAALSAGPCDLTPHLRTLAKGVYAVGGLTRFHGGAQRDFFALGGVGFLTRALQVSLGAMKGVGVGEEGTTAAAAGAAGRAVLAKTLHLLADLALPEEVYEDPRSTPDVTTSNLLRFRLDALNATTLPTPTPPPPPQSGKEGGGGVPLPPKIVRLSGEGGVDEGGVKHQHATPPTSTPSAWVLALTGEPVGKQGLCQGVAQTLGVLGEGVLEVDEGARVKAFCA